MKSGIQKMGVCGKVSIKLEVAWSCWSRAGSCGRPGESRLGWVGGFSVSRPSGNSMQSRDRENSRGKVVSGCHSRFLVGHRLPATDTSVWVSRPPSPSESSLGGRKEAVFLWGWTEEAAPLCVSEEKIRRGRAGHARFPAGGGPDQCILHRALRRLRGAGRWG